MRRRRLIAAALVVAAGAVAAFVAAAALAGTSRSASCGIAGAPVLPVGKVMTTPSAGGCDIWRVSLRAGDRVTVRVISLGSPLFIGFLTPGLTDDVIATNDQVVNDLRGTDCEMKIEEHQSEQNSCTVAGTHNYYLRAEAGYGATEGAPLAQIQVLVKHATPKPTIGTCDIFAKAPFIRVGVPQVGDDYQACPDKAMGQYLGTDKSPYPFGERWLLHVQRATTLTLTGALTTPGSFDQSNDFPDAVQVIKPNTDPTNYPTTEVIFIPGKKEICRLEVGAQAAATQCTFPKPGNYIVFLGADAHTVRFTFSR